MAFPNQESLILGDTSDLVDPGFDLRLDLIPDAANPLELLFLRPLEFGWVGKRPVEGFPHARKHVAFVFILPDADINKQPSGKDSPEYSKKAFSPKNMFILALCSLSVNNT